METPSLTEPAPLSNIDVIRTKIYDLQKQLETNAPGYPSLLHVIHQAISKDPDIAHILTEEDIGIICAGLGKRKNIVIAEVESKSKSSKNRTASGKSLKDVGLSDL